jgi:hypothetical protein
MLSSIYKKIKAIRIQAAAILILLLIVLVFFTKNILLEASLFIFCLVFIIRFGQFFFLDIDPTPLCAFIILYFHNYTNAIIFLALAIPLIDGLSGRLCHFSLMTFFSATLIILILGLSPFKGLAILFGILMFDGLRMALILFFGFGLEAAMFSLIHGMIYLVAGSVLKYFI